MSHRNRVVQLFALPIAVFIFIIGWTLLYLGSKQKPIGPKLPIQKNLSLITLYQEQEIFA
jgi:hypothetical protein